jgi:uncharacterized membrane protein YjjB (DUF3815 family)
MSRKTLLVAGLLACLVVAGALIFVVHLVSGPANGTVLKTMPVQSTAATGDKILASKYFTTHYPARYSQVPTGSSASLQSWTLVGHQETAGQESSKISVVITALPAGGVKEDSSYKLYNAYPALYKLSQASYGHDSVIIAKRSDSGYQQTVLWPHGNYLLTISLTSGSESSLIDSEMQTVLSHLQWLI